MNNLELQERLEIIAGGYPASEMENALRLLLREADREAVASTAKRVIGQMELWATVFETHPPEYMARPLDEIPPELHAWATEKRQSAARLRQDVTDFKAALANLQLHF